MNYTLKNLSIYTIKSVHNHGYTTGSKENYINITDVFFLVFPGNTVLRKLTTLIVAKYFLLLIELSFNVGSSFNLPINE